MRVRLIGAGCSSLQFTQEETQAVKEAQLIIGAPRVLDSLPECKAEKLALYKPDEICSALLRRMPGEACVALSGDSGFYSGARGLVPILRENGISFEILPGISSVQTLSARLGESWQDWRLCSAHGVFCDPVAEIMSGRRCFFLCGGESSPSRICSELTLAGLGALGVFVGERLACSDEKILRGTAAEFAGQEFAALSVLLTDAAPVAPAAAPGIPDEEFMRGSVPMTKREVRAVIASMLRLKSSDICWDIGAGTGSVSVELALHSRGVWSLERDPEALKLINLNREKFRAWNMRIIKADAPDGLSGLPAPDAVFIGGSGGKLGAIVDAVFAANSGARVCISAISLETLSSACGILRRHGCAAEVTQLAVSRARPAGEHNLLVAQNPVFLIAGGLQ